MRFNKLLILVCLLMVAALSMAYVQPLPLMFSNMAEKTGVWKSMEVIGFRTVTDTENGKKYREDFVLSLKRPKTARLQVTNTVTGKITRVRKFNEHERRMLDIILLSSDKAKLYGTLKSWGIEGETIGLTRIDRTVCQIFGALETQPDKNQFWVEKFDYFPARLIYLYEKAGEFSRNQITMTGWNSPMTDGFFPHKIEISENGQVLQKWEVTEIKLPGKK